MIEVKDFISSSIIDNPQRYAVDTGAIHLVNDFFIVQGWQPLTKEQHKAIANIIRGRNYFLNDNKAYDKRIEKTSYEYIGQTSIYDYIEDSTAKQFQKITSFCSKDPIRCEFTNSRLKKSVRGVDNAHIDAVRLIQPLLIANPQLKQKRQHKLPTERTSNSILGSEEETNND